MSMASIKTKYRNKLVIDNNIRCYLSFTQLGFYLLIAKTISAFPLIIFLIGI